MHKTQRTLQKREWTESGRQAWRGSSVQCCPWDMMQLLCSWIYRAVLNSTRSRHSKFQHRGSSSRALTLTWRLLGLRDCESAFCRVGATGRFSMLQRMTSHPCSYVHAKGTKYGVVGFKTKGAVERGAGALWRCLGELGERNESWTWSEHIVYMDEILKI